MKKTALVLVLLMLSAGFAGCSQQEEPLYRSQASVSSVQQNESDDEDDLQNSPEEVSEKSEDESKEVSQKAESSVTSQESVKEESSKAESREKSENSVEEVSEKVSEVSVRETTSVPSEEPSREPSGEPAKPASAEPSKEEQKSEPSAVSEVSETSKTDEASKTEPIKPDVKDENDIGGIELYNEIFNTENRVTVDISVDKSEMDKLQADYQRFTAKDENKKSEIYRVANVTFRVGSKSYTVEEVGIRLKGNQSIKPFYDEKGNPNMCSFKLSFDETFDDEDDYGNDVKKWTDENAKKARKKRKFATMSEMDIKWNISYDNTNIREIYATKLFEAADVFVQKINLSQMNINGNNYGLVKIYEPVDKNFLEKRLPESAVGGDLYKCMWSECNNTGKRTGWWRGATYKTDNSYGIQKNQEGIKYNFNLKTNKKTSKHESLRNFLSVINKANVTKEELEKVLDVDYYAAFMAAEYFAGDPDDMRNNYNNHYIYFRKDNGKAIFIVYDNDRTMGITYGLNKNCAVRNPYSSYAATQGEQENPLIQKTISHNSLAGLAYIRDKYADELKKLSMTEILTSDAEFNKMYNTAKGNYESIIKPYTRFSNQEQEFRFSLDGNKNGGEKDNMSFEQFRSTIMSTYESAKP